MGWNGSEGGSGLPRRNASRNDEARMRCSPKSGALLIGLVALIIAMACWWCLRDSSEEVARQDAAPPKKIATVKPAKPAPTNKVTPPKVDNKENDLQLARQKRREMLKNMTPDERLAYVLEEMKKRPIRDEPSSNRIFRTGLEQVMDWVFSCEVGAPPPLLPQMSLFDRAHLAEILIMDNPIKETDSERAKMAKENVQLAKKEFINFIKEGGDPDDFLPYYHGQLVAAHQEWTLARQTAIETLKNDPDIAQEYVKRINERLAEKGIKPVQLPPKLLERYGLNPEE